MDPMHSAKLQERMCIAPAFKEPNQLVNLDLFAMVYILAKNAYLFPHPLFPGRLIFPEKSVIFPKNRDTFENFGLK